MAAPPGLDASQILSWKGRSVHNTDLVGSVHIGDFFYALTNPSANTAGSHTDRLPFKRQELSYVQDYNREQDRNLRPWSSALWVWGTSKQGLCRATGNVEHQPGAAGGSLWGDSDTEEYTGVCRTHIGNKRSEGRVKKAPLRFSFRRKIKHSTFA